MKHNAKRNSPLVVSFSGMDGAGKSTQIENLCAFLQNAGLRIRFLAFWDEVASLARVREWMSLHLFKGDPGVGTPDKPVNRQDKNVESIYLNAARFLLYFFDSLAVKVLMAKISRDRCDVIVFDRYIYDELANLPLRGRFSRAYVALIAKLCPQPDIAFVLDAIPEEARARKPEYPIEFLRRNREAYLSLSSLAGMVVVPAMSEPQMAARIAQHVNETLRLSPPEDHSYHQVASKAS